MGGKAALIVVLGFAFILGMLALFTCFLCGFIVLTVIGTHFRGPNWEFFWSPADWPKH
jgi:hypothetical protein